MVAIVKFLKDGRGKDTDRLRKEDVYVLGDCKAASVDSQVFGILPKEKIVGRLLARI